MAKIHPKGIVAVKAGPTITKNDPAKFSGAGKTSGKMDGAKQIVHQATGPTLTCNKTLISTPNADKSPKHKQLGERSTGGFKLTETATSKTASQHGGGGQSDRPYPLKRSYEKHGKTMTKGAKSVL